MLSSALLDLRPVRSADLDVLLTNLNRLVDRGLHFPLGLHAEPVFRQKFEASGFWGDDEGMLLMVTPDDVIVGEIEFFPITSYLTGLELSYLVFDPALRRRGYATEAVRLLTAYLFARLRIERLQLNIHPDNTASLRVAAKAGYTLEGLMRRCWFNGGRFHDLQVWSMLRDEQPSP